MTPLREQQKPIIIVETKTTEGAINAGVGQDKYPPGRIDVFSDQTQTATDDRESAMNTKCAIT